MLKKNINLPVFALAIFIAAAQMFWIQPLLAKMLLPTVGGAPAVWNICMVFFQSALLAGYGYAHLSARRLSVGQQVILHSLLLAFCAAFLPIVPSESWAQDLATATNPLSVLLTFLVTTAGLPILAVSSTSPLLQNWFAINKPLAEPYQLYVASNLGSLGALLGYPLVAEPFLRLNEQSSWWTAGFLLFALLVITCGILTWHSHKTARSPKPISAPTASLPWSRKWRWLLLAFAPSSLMLGVTQYFVTDIASIPLLWVLPLSLYLLSFVLAFARRTFRITRPFRLVLLSLMLAVTFSVLSWATTPLWLLLLLHLGFLLIAATACHGRLAAERPPPEHLTTFYLWLAGGGVLGGCFNTLLAPLVFSTVQEYPVAIILVALWLPGVRSEEKYFRWSDLLWAAGVGLLTFLLITLEPAMKNLSRAVRISLLFGLPLIAVFLTSDRPMRLALALAGVFVGGHNYASEHGNTIHVERSFFGVSRITEDGQRVFRRLVHGNTCHGGQLINPQRQMEPLAYFHRTGPLGGIFSAHQARKAAARVGVIGLGTGSIASYARPSEAWTFFEIDPVVIKIARNTNWFTYLSNCSAQSLRIVAGDARLQLLREPDHGYDLLILDAFSSDCIPIHLLTREALQLYRRKITPDGVLACHISNRYLDLEYVLGALAREAGLVGYNNEDWLINAAEAAQGKCASQWVVLARKASDVGQLTSTACWLPLEANGVSAWSDDFSNLLTVFCW